MRSRTPGFTFVEVLVTVAIVSAFLLVLGQLFFGTQRQAVGTEARFTAALLAQMVVERLKSELTLDPGLLRRLDPAGTGRWTASGRVADAAAGARVSPFFEHLFARGGNDLYAPGNRLSVSPEAFRDWQVDVVVTDDEPPATAGANTQLLRELVKRVQVTVARDTSSFTLHARLLAPVENLSMPALDRLFENFESTRLEAAYEEFYEAVADNPHFVPGGIDPAARDLLADCYIVLGAINTEAYLSDGQTIAGNTVLTTSRPTSALSTWVRTLSTPEYYQHSVFKKELAQINTMRVTTLFDAFKKISPVLKHLLDQQDEMLPRVQSIGEALTTSRDRIAALNAETMELIRAYRAARTTAADPMQATTAQVAMTGSLDQIRARVAAFAEITQRQGDELSTALELITVVKFLDDFFNRQTCRKVFDRLKEYPARFTGLLDEIERPLRDFLDQSDGPTPYERVIASQRFVEVTKLRQLDLGRADPPALSRIQRLAEATATTMRPLSTYLKTSDVHDYTALAARNARFLSALQEMKLLARRYDRVVRAYDAGGTIREMLVLYQTVRAEIELESGGVMAQIQSKIGTLGDQMDLASALDGIEPPAAP
jgi:type II secretory pathway pseudopilin PulG